jgi:GTP-binding protein HflX
MPTKVGRGTADEKAIVLTPVVSHDAGDRHSTRDPATRLAEAVALARAINLKVEEATTVRLTRPNPAGFLGKGKIQEIGELIHERGLSLAILDCALSPVQQRNLERAWNVKVIDRTGLILEIFGRRAKTKEGRLQVQLAHLVYQRSRLVRSWTHLGRQRGGFGFIGGPGETQIESDRRHIRERIARLQAEIDHVQSTRRMHRARRKRNDYRSVALVGYTNAGKSTLFNRLVEAGVEESSMLFATLDPTLRHLSLPHGTKAILSDTVGFISDLPTTLVAAFRATLEEVTEADLILHVRDIESPETDSQRSDVRSVIQQLGLDPDDNDRFIEVWNKVDLLDTERRSALYNQAGRDPNGLQAFPVSAKTGAGLDELRRGIEQLLVKARRTVRLAVESSRPDAMAWLYENAEVLGSRLDHDTNVVTVRIDEPHLQSFERRFSPSQLTAPGRKSAVI